jgi:hypothetical protein
MECATYSYLKQSLAYNLIKNRGWRPAANSHSIAASCRLALNSMQTFNHPSNLSAAPAKDPNHGRTMTAHHNSKIALLLGGLVIAMVGVLSFQVIHWQVADSLKKAALCEDAKQTMKNLEIRARALASGLTVEAYAKAEADEVAALIKQLDAARNDAEVNAVIDAHAAALEAKGAAVDEQVETAGDQTFLEQRLVRQRIPVDVKQELRRAAKAVSEACH